MRFAFDEDQLLFRDAVRDVLRNECTAERVRAAWDDRSGRVAKAWAKLAEVGVVGMTASERWGGLGSSELDTVLVHEESGRAALPDPLVETTAVGIPLLEEVGSDALVDCWLGAVASGRAVIGVGLAHARYVSGAADLYLLERGDALYAVTPEQAELRRRASVDGARVLFEIEWTPGTEALATGAAARAAAARAFDRGALATAAQLCGLARHMIDVTVEYATVREQFGRPIGSFQAVKHRMADALIALEFARPLVYRAAHSLARGDAEQSTHVSMAKAYASDAAETASRAALQCHGAIGYSFEYDLHLWMKRAWALAAAWGSSAWHRARVGRALLGDDQ
jgi:alkylation response protein AidB-like acyl-CoA dehydrogenase